MPAPRLGVSGLGRLGLSLYDVLAARELERIKAAAAAEAARQQRFKEANELATARRADAKQLLEEQIARNTREKDLWEQEHPTLSLVSNLNGPEGRPQAQYANPRTGGLVGSPFMQYEKPPDPRITLHPGVDPAGTPEYLAFDENKGTAATVPGHRPPPPVQPRDPPESFSPLTGTDAEGNPVVMSFGNRTGRATLLPNVTPPIPRPTTDDKDNLADYENTKFGNAEMAKWETRLKPNDLVL